MTQCRKLKRDFKCFGKKTDSWRDLVLLAQFYGLKTHNDLAEFIGVHPRTVHRWYETNAAPVYAWRLLLYKTDHLGAVFPEWQDWCIKGENIYDPGGFRVNKTTLFMCQIEGTEVTKARRLKEDAERKLQYFTECLAALLMMSEKPDGKPRKTLKLFTENGDPLILSMQ